MSASCSAPAIAREQESVKVTPAAPAHAYRLLFLVTLLGPVGNLCLAWGVKQFPQTLALNPAVYLKIIFNPLVAAGIVMQILCVLNRMSLLSIADLSFVLPITSAGYILSTLLARMILHEPVSAARWAGTVLIALGAALVASTLQRHVPQGVLQR